ncbi:hypothetical protein K435DRAFT_80000 [Dendrothele bispora CBS 962.96]|uniref:Uncharacterized protein n=1 Tax=Dendrothele bispora (strain CBS 962.96) TaxID=1314807 RepID=A0A4S8M4I6_DENBC|nr:hypothetical protein K435DRAFT_80000 [Dendrothele bispora CBS 962.96]
MVVDVWGECLMGTDSIGRNPKFCHGRIQMVSSLLKKLGARLGRKERSLLCIPLYNGKSPMGMYLSRRKWIHVPQKIGLPIPQEVILNGNTLSTSFSGDVFGKMVTMDNREVRARNEREPQQTHTTSPVIANIRGGVCGTDGVDINCPDPRW